MSRTVGVVIPAYNPDTTVLTAYVKALQDSVADTVHVELDAPSESVLGITHCADSINIAPERRGKGQAITDGFNALSTDILAFADADGSVPLTSVDSVISPVRRGTADLAIGSRRHPDAVIKTHQTRLRRRMGDVFAVLARHTLPTAVYDYQCGMKALSAGVWEALRPIHESGFAWDLELIAMAGAMNYHIEEVPITWDDDPDSTVDPLPTAINMLKSLLTIRHRVRTFNGGRIHSVLSQIGDKASFGSNRSSED